jgi:hypothetical protein
MALHERHHRLEIAGIERHGAQPLAEVGLEERRQTVGVEVGEGHLLHGVVLEQVVRRRAALQAGAQNQHLHSDSTETFRGEESPRN